MRQNTVEVKVTIADKNLKVGAMAKALAFGIGSQNAVSRATNLCLQANGFLTFRFSSESHAKDFRKDVNDYLAVYGARV